MLLQINDQYKEKKICIFTNYRTGSSFLNSRIANVNRVAALGEKFSYYGTSNNPDIFEKCFRDLTSTPRFAIKLMADHLNFDHDKIEQVLNSVDKIIYLYRKDFVAQAKSYIASASTNTYTVNGFKEYGQTPENSIITIDALSHEQIDTYVNVLKENYLTMSYFYKKIPGELRCLENFEIKKPYKKTIIWKDEEPIIPDFDVESLFK
jgi:LPS sulfotransferase NodH